MRAIFRVPAVPALLAAAIAAAAAVREHSPPPAAMPEADRIRLAEAFRLADWIGDGIWPGWSGVPFALVLVTNEIEYFVRHDMPPADARPLGQDALLGSEIYARPRSFPTQLLATFPIEGISTVVVGQPVSTATTSPTDWVVTLLHEHFHQLQDSQPGFYEKVAALGLARGDDTGMWMLNFPFPYDSPAVAERYRAAASALRAAVSGGDPAVFRAARAKFRAGLAADDLKYLDFQLWKEGVARYTQLRVARFAASGYEPLPDFAALPGFVTYAALAQSLLETISKELSQLTLTEARRVVVYPFGAGEALLLDRERPCWREQYFSKMFTLAPAFDRKDCGKGKAARG
jgi:hypothetical protein